MKTDAECCQYCKCCVKEHSMDWFMRSDGDPLKPDEKDSEYTVYGVYRELVMHTEKIDGIIVDSGLRISQIICSRCWEEGKRFKKIYASSKSVC